MAPSFSPIPTRPRLPYILRAGITWFEPSKVDYFEAVPEYTKVKGDDGYDVDGEPTGKSYVTLYIQGRDKALPLDLNQSEAFLGYIAETYRTRNLDEAPPEAEF